MPEKVFLLDTNVYLHDPDALKNFENTNNRIIVPFEILEELDGLKNKKDSLGYNAREAIRQLNNFVQLSDPIDLDIEFLNSTKLITNLSSENKEIYRLYNSDGIDNKLLAIAKAYPLSHPEIDKVVFISKDINIRLKAKAVDIEADDYYSDKIDVYELERKNRKTIIVGSELINKIYKFGYIDKLDLPTQSRGLYDNMPIILKDEEKGSQSALSYYKNGKFILINDSAFKKYGINSLSTGQTFALQFLFDPTIIGTAIFSESGAGKTYISLSAGLSQIPDKYKKIIIAKPVVPVGRDIGFLPGSSSDKMIPWLAGYMDNIEQIIPSDPRVNKKSKYHTYDDDSVYNLRQDLWDYLLESGTIEIQPIAFIRGRSFVDSFIIIDECQNLSVDEIKTILTRIGKNSKVVLLGDINQIDNAYLDKYSNGLVQVIASLRGIPEFAYIKLDRIVRSSFVEQVVKRL